ncbi:hypothetical protein JCM19992_12680 [Thermostilla marina]
MADDRPRTALLADLYMHYLESQDTAAFLKAVRARYTQGTLQRLVASFDDVITRRAAVLVLGFVGDYESNHVLGRALNDKDRTTRMMAETSIRKIWMRFGNPEHRREIAVIARMNAAKRYHEVIRRASALIDELPDFAEAYNQRAVAFFGQGEFAEAIRDCHQALELNPYHFGAAAGMGQAYLELNDPVSALEAFRRALRLNPDLEAVRVQVHRLSRLIEDS